MAFRLSGADDELLTTFLAGILDAYSSKEVSKEDAIAALAHVMTACVIDNEGEVRAWLEKPETLQNWKKDVSA